MTTLVCDKGALGAFLYAFEKVPVNGLRTQHVLLVRGLGKKLRAALVAVNGAPVSLGLTEDELKLLSLKFFNMELGSVAWTEAMLDSIVSAQDILRQAVTSEQAQEQVSGEVVTG